MQMPSREAARFAQVVQDYQAARGGVATSDQEYRALANLVTVHGVDSVRQAMAEARDLGNTPLRLDRLSAILGQIDPLLAQVMALYTQEIEPTHPITPLVREQMIALVDEFPDLDWWQEGFRRMVKSGSRNLRRVVAILRERQETGSWERPAPARRPADDAARKPGRRPASRETKYAEEDLKRAREEDEGAVWQLPDDVF